MQGAATGKTAWSLKSGVPGALKVLVDYQNPSLHDRIDIATVPANREKAKACRFPALSRDCREAGYVMT